MAKTPTPETIAAELTVPERALLFCLASNTDWAKAGVTLGRGKPVRGAGSSTPTRGQIGASGRRKVPAKSHRTYLIGQRS